MDFAIPATPEAGKQTAKCHNKIRSTPYESETGRMQIAATRPAQRRGEHPGRQQRSTGRGGPPPANRRARDVVGPESAASCRNRRRKAGRHRVRRPWFAAALHRRSGPDARRPPPGGMPCGGRRKNPGCSLVQTGELTDHAARQRTEGGHTVADRGAGTREIHHEGAAGNPGQPAGQTRIQGTGHPP